MATSNKTAGKRNAGEIIVTIVLILAIVLVIVCSYTAYVAKAGDGVPSIFGYEPFAVQSDSMAPFFYEGDLVIDKTVTDYSEIQVGDIITFWTVINGYKVLNTHRVVSIGDGGTFLYYETKGDANSISDTTTVHQADIVGKYVTHIPKVGGFLDFLQTSKGFLICIVIPVAIFFIYQLVVFFKTLTAYRTEKMRMQIQAEMGVAPDAGVAAAQPVQAAPVQAATQPTQTAPAQTVAQPEAQATAAVETAEVKAEEPKAADPFAIPEMKFDVPDFKMPDFGKDDK